MIGWLAGSFCRSWKAVTLPFSAVVIASFEENTTGVELGADSGCLRNTAAKLNPVWLWPSLKQDARSVKKEKKYYIGPLQFVLLVLSVNSGL